MTSRTSKASSADVDVGAATCIRRRRAREVGHERARARRPHRRAALAGAAADPDHRHSGRAEARRRRARQRLDHLRAADRADADRHADLDLARPHGAHVPVHDDDGADRVGGAEAVHRHREVRDHGDPVLHPRRQLPDARRRRAADDQLRLVDGRPLARRPRPRRRDGVRAVRRGVGVVAGDGGRDRLDHPAGDGEAGLSRSASAPA